MSNRTLHLLTPDILLRAYAAGIFPMAESAESTDLHWFDPPVRAVIPLDSTFHVPKRLRRTIRQKPYTIKLDTSFRQVMRLCTAPAPGRTTTWINREITDLYSTLHWRGHAHSIEAWDGKELVGGLYGVSLGGAFFGESMFSCKPDASKISLVYLVALMRQCGFTLLDTQFQTEHLSQFGTHEITRANYLHMLPEAIKKRVVLQLPKEIPSPAKTQDLLRKSEFSLPLPQGERENSLWDYLALALAGGVGAGTDAGAAGA